MSIIYVISIFTSILWSELQTCSERIVGAFNYKFQYWSNYFSVFYLSINMFLLYSDFLRHSTTYWDNDWYILHILSGSNCLSIRLCLHSTFSIRSNQLLLIIYYNMSSSHWVYYTKDFNDSSFQYQTVQTKHFITPISNNIYDSQNISIFFYVIYFCLSILQFYLLIYITILYFKYLPNIITVIIRNVFLSIA